MLSEVKLAIGEVADAVASRTAATGGATGPSPPWSCCSGSACPTSASSRCRGTSSTGVEPDHLTSVCVPALAAPIAGEVAAFADVVRRLRAECPWDREQTHQSLRRHLLEEAYEVLEAIDHLDVAAGEGFDALEEELGDLLFQVVFHATLAAEEGRFTLADVARGIHTS